MVKNRPLLRGVRRSLWRGYGSVQSYGNLIYVEINQLKQMPKDGSSTPVSVGTGFGNVKFNSLCKNSILLDRPTNERERERRRCENPPEAKDELRRGESFAGLQKRNRQPTHNIWR